jgi:argininosuccinate lyase
MNALQRGRDKRSPFPDPVYAETVLAVNFADFQRSFTEALLEIHRAHLAMLAEQRILQPADARALLAALNGSDLEQLRAARFDGSSEDVFFYMEQQIAARSDPDVAGRLHTARSRNDIAITLYRMETRREILDVVEQVIALRQALLALAANHIETLLPAHTHTQPAQPTTLAHYLMAAVEVLERDARRLQAAWQTVNRCPLGACAITTTGFPIDRRRTAHLLGFDDLQLNSYGAIASVDYLLESAGVVAAAMISLGRFTQDLLLWGMQEFGFLRLPDGFVQGSSIMPQKRNPVALEHARILASRSLGEAQAVFTALHNTPFGDIVDAEDDLLPLVFTMFHNAGRAFRLVAAAMENACFNGALMARQAAAHFLTATELADTLVREAGLSFHEAHHLVSQAVQAAPEDDSPARIAGDLLRLAPGVVSRESIMAALDPAVFVERRAIPGGPARSAIEPEIARATRVQTELLDWLHARRAALEAAHRELHAWSL